MPNSELLSDSKPSQSLRRGTSIVQARGITKSFTMGETKFTVLKGLDFDLMPGEFVAIEGRSGSGKSTLLHILAALDSVDGGSVLFEGVEYTNRTPHPTFRWLKVLTEDPGDGVLATLARFLIFVVSTILEALLHAAGFTIVPPSIAHPLAVVLYVVIGVVAGLQLIRVVKWCWVTFRFLNSEGPSARMRNQQFGFIFQFYHLLPELNVLENAMLSPSIEHSTLGVLLRRDELRHRATALLEQLGMSHRLKHRPGQLSGGERQRVAIARALMNNPKVLFADEPTGNLDAETGRQIMDVLEKLHRDTGQTIVMVTHDRSLAREADRVLVLKDGKLEPAV